MSFGHDSILSGGGSGSREGLAMNWYGSSLILKISLVQYFIRSWDEQRADLPLIGCWIMYSPTLPHTTLLYHLEPFTHSTRQHLIRLRLILSYYFWNIYQIFRLNPALFRHHFFAHLSGNASRETWKTSSLTRH